MNSLETFRDFLKKLDSIWQGNYSELHVNRIYRKLGHLTVDQYNILLDYIIDNVKYRPLPNEFYQYLSHLNLHRRHIEKEGNRNCPFCNGLFTVAVRNKKGLDYTYKCHKCDGSHLSKEIPIFDPDTIDNENWFMADTWNPKQEQKDKWEKVGGLKPMTFFLNDL